MNFPWRFSFCRDCPPRVSFKLHWFALVALIFCAALPLHVFAIGIGISPPYVRNDSLTRGSHYEQKILIVRGEASDDLKVDVTVNVPGADKWISVDRGSEFIIPKGETKLPMIVSVDVPKDASFKQYTGYVRIVVSPLALPKSGTVGVTIGAQANVRLNVVDNKIIAFKVFSVSLADAEVGHTFWWMHFPGKIISTILAENTGNVDAPLGKIVLDIYDPRSGKLLEETQNSNGMDKISPFETTKSYAEIPTFLPVGSYRASYKVYKDDSTVISTGNLNVAVLPSGSITGYIGYGFMGLPLKDKSITIGLIAFILALLYYIFRQFVLLRRRKMRAKSSSSSLPPSPPPRA